MTPIELEKLADEILLKIRRKPLRGVSLKTLASTFKVEIADVVSALKMLEQWGYRLDKPASGEIALHSVPDILTATEIGFGLKTKVIGRKIHSYQSVRSTNDIALGLAEQGEKEGVIVTAEEQTKGKGRLGRQWHSPRRKGIYVSIILRPKLKPELAPGLAIMTALALADSLSRHCPGQVKIKWPNDLQIGGRKVSGILTELSAEKNKTDYVVIGVGINANHTADDFPPELRSIATSVRLAKRKKVDRVKLLQDFLVAFEKEYRRYLKRQLAPSRKRLVGYSSLLGTKVRLSIGRRTVEGMAVDIDDAGALIIEKDGKRQQISSGEVSIVKDRH